VVKKLFAFVLGGLAILMLTGYSPESPEYPKLYECQVRIANDTNSSEVYIEVYTSALYNDYLERNDVHKSFRQFYIEKDKIVDFIHYSYISDASHEAIGKLLANPNKAFAKINIYNAASGTLIKEEIISDASFQEIRRPVGFTYDTYYLLNL
jgi:hypothetical protein